MCRVYFARAMDGMDAEHIACEAKEVARELAAHGMQMVDTFVEVKSDEDLRTFDEKAREIVERDLALLKSADAVLMNCSIPGRSYVGCICELVYAYLWRIPVVVYVGSSDNDKRYWLQYHATHVCRSRNEAVDALISLFVAEREP